MRILLVEDNLDSLRSLKIVLADLGHDPVGVDNAAEALECAQREYFPLVITDIRMPGMDGLELLGRLKSGAYGADADVVIITGHGDMETAVEALRKGAYDYLNKPINARELAAVVERSAERQSLLAENFEFKTQFQTRVQEATQDLRADLNNARRRLREACGLGGVVAVSPAMRQLVAEAELYHRNPEVAVLIEGETGTGKEILARLIHYGDGFATTPFEPINCAAIPAELFESELFGHDPGAYTGSTRRGRPGKVELAGQGALFLDEIVEMPLSLQPKLLRVVEDRTFYRVGGVKRLEFKARLISAANSDLGGLVESGRFRRDLFHRLKVGYLVIPPLRERPEDIESLVQVFLRREATRKKKRFREAAPDALALLRGHPWPGNVRELENVIERAVLTADGEILRVEHLNFLLGDRARVVVPVALAGEGGELDTRGPTAAHAASPPLGTDEPSFDPRSIVLPEHKLDIDTLTQRIICLALEKFGGNKTKTAAYLGLSRYALHRRLEGGASTSSRSEAAAPDLKEAPASPGDSAA
jgi:two-component system response regulator AtoC